MRMVLWGVLVLFASACGAREGGSCSSSNEGKAVCGDDKTELVCEGGKYRAFPCKGPGGCAANSDRVQCDASANVAGDPCPKVNQGTAQCTTTDAHVRLTCNNGMLTAEHCVLPCAESNGTVTCL